MKQQKCPKCETEYDVQTDDQGCPNCRTEKGSEISSRRRLDETIERPSIVMPSEYPISAPLPPKIGEGGEPDGLRERSVEDAGLPEFQLMKELDQGAFGKVFRSLQVPLDRKVAVKILKDEFHTHNDVRANFFKEAQITGQLEHPNIVPIHDIGVTDGGDQPGSPFYVMKEIKGSSWAQVIREKTRDENVEILKRVVDAIGFAHSKNILHCDLKPQNVMLGEYGEVLVVDWGHAIDTTRPESFRCGGTLVYMPPEMAGYYLSRDPGKFAHLEWEIGPRSDVYLLGGILFEIITGCYPHVDPKGDCEPPSEGRKAMYPSEGQLKTWALDNRICDYSQHAEDELLQIALRALRKKDEEIVTVEQFKDALNTYEKHKRSIEIRNRAYELLEEAEQTSNYDTFQKSKLGFEESLELWNENPLAEEGLRKTCLSCAAVALKEQNFDLGLGMLDRAESDAELQLRRKLEVGKRQRDRRKGFVAFLSAAFALAVVSGLTVSIYWYIAASNQQVIANRAKNDSVAAKAAAEKATIASVAAEAEAEVAKVDAGKAKADADKKVKLAEASAHAAETRASLANDSADDANQVAKMANEVARRARYRTSVIEIEQNIRSGDFHGANDLLVDLKEGHDSFEWRRLDLLSHQEIKPLDFESLDGRKTNGSLQHIKFSGDRTKLVLGFKDRIIIRNTEEPDRSVTVERPNVEAIAVSHSGKKIAVAAAGKITISNLDSLQLSEVSSELEAQSDSITDLAFSLNGDRLISVGKPNAIQKSARLEHELMCWELKGNEWGKLGPAKFGGKNFAPITAQFSGNGERILLLDRLQGNEGQAIVVQRQQVQATKPFYEFVSSRRGVGHSVFADTEGTRVLSAVNSGSPTHQLQVWSVSPKNILFKSPNVNSKIVQLDFHKDAILAATQDKRSLYWQLDDSGLAALTKAPQVFRGHQNEISYVGITEPTKFVSISKAGPEILKTNIDSYKKEEIQLRPEAKLINTETASTSFFESQSNRRAILGNDGGLVSIHDLDIDDTDKPAGLALFNLETGAWANHIVTDNHLFAISKRDHIYRYDLVTGELQTVLTFDNPTVESSEKISTIEISRNSRFAVLQRDNGMKEFEIWRLDQPTRPTLIKTVRLGSGRFSALNEETVGHLTISPDGKWIAAAKVSTFVWRNDGTFVGQVGNQTQLESPTNSVRFFSGAPKMAVSYKGRVKLFDLADTIQPAGVYQVQELPDSNNIPNLVDAGLVNGLPHLLTRRMFEEPGKSSLGLQLLSLNQGRVSVIGKFSQADNGSFFQEKALLVTRDKTRPVIVFDVSTRQEKTRKISVQVPASDSSAADEKPNAGRTRFSRVYMNRNQELVLSWKKSGKNNTVSVDRNDLVGELIVTAAPPVKSVGMNSELAVTLADSKLRLWRLSGKDNLSVTPDQTIAGSYRFAEISPDAKKALVVSSWNSDAAIVFLKGGQEIEKINGGANVTSVTWTSDSSTLAIGYANGEIQIDGATIHASEGSIEQLNFSDGGQFLVAVRESGTALVLRKTKLENDGATWKEVAGLGHPDQDPIRCADITANGERVITGSSRGRVTLWDAENHDDAIEAEGDSDLLKLSVSDSEPALQPELPDPDRALLTISRLDSEVRSVSFVREDSAVVALETQSAKAVMFPTAK